ncbi:MAG TPA: tripartite tricarboxylate transporter substrate-binding protein [Pseudolabrys sp.]
MSDRLQQKLGQPFIVEDRPGGNTIIGTQAVAVANPDGYTLLVGNAAVSINQNLVQKLPYDYRKDLIPVSHLGESYALIVVNPNFPAKTLPELIAAAKAAPGKYSTAIGGSGTNYGIAFEQLKEITGINLVMIPYKGTTPALNDVVAGQVPIFIDNLVPLAPQVKAGNIRALAVLSATRSPDLPDVPTTAEVGLPDVVVYAYNALFAPAGTPREIVNKLNAAVNEILADPEVIERSRLLGIKLGGGSPEKAKATIDKVTDIYADVIKKANIPLQ